jgi:hypothetical protein
MSDILWQNTNGTTSIWLMNGTGVIGGGNLGNVATSWRITGTADFNGDGRSDIVWQNANGTVSIWEMSGTSVIGGGNIGDPGPTWHVVGTGNFFGNRFSVADRSDLLFQNDDGTVAIWQMSGTSLVGGGLIGNPGASWHVVGTGDFYGNGLSDILWQNDDGTAAIWQLNGTSIVGGGTVGNPGAGWRVAGTGDYNGDGKSDILWQNSDGSTSIWEMSGTSVIGGGSLGNPGSSWHAVGSDPMRFISGASGNSTLTASGSDEFVFTTFAAGAHTISGFDPTHDIIELSKADFANFAAVEANITTSGGNAVIALDGQSTLLLPGVAPSSLHNNNFAFV